MTQRRDVAVKPAKLRKMLASLPLPAMPDCAVRILELTGERDDDLDRCTKLIESDAAMAVQLLRYSNSSYFGFRHRISSIRQAIMLQGLRKVRNFVLSNAVFGVVPDPGKPGFSMVAFRCDSLRRALFGRALAGRMGLPDAEDVFTAALLQDVAIPLLMRQFGDEYLDAFGEADSYDADRALRERETFGWTHADAACLLFSRWKLPKVLSDLVRRHTDPVAATASTKAGPDVQAVAMSSLLPSVRDEVWVEAGLFDDCWVRIAFASEVSPADLLGEVDEAFQSLAQVLNTGPAARDLKRLHGEAAQADGPS